MSTKLSKNENWINELDIASKRTKEQATLKEFIIEPLKNEPAKESVPRKKLFLSVEGLMIDMLPRKLSQDGPDGKTEVIQPVKQEDLNTGLFYFGCTREDFFNFEKGGPIANQLKGFGNKGLTNFRLIENAIEKAEKEGRVFWLEKSKHKDGHSYDDLNNLFTKNNIKGIIEAMPDQTREADFEDVVKDQIKELGLPLDVVG